MRKYRIYTENKNLDAIADHITEWTAGFTIYLAIGYWKGIRESAATIEIVSPDGDGELSLQDVEKIARWIKETNNQDAVLVTCENVAGGIV